jgi:hypothetical protein
MWWNKSLVMSCWTFHFSGAVFMPTMTEGPVGTHRACLMLDNND